MISSLSVISLVTRLMTTTSTTYGEAVYREKVSENNITFAFKQFSNAKNEYNEILNEGDLVFFGGKFTIDEEKVLVSIVLSFASM